MKAKGKMDPRMMEKLGISSATSQSARAASVASIDRGNSKIVTPNGIKST
jgi:hypothetical protein